MSKTNAQRLKEHGDMYGGLFTKRQPRSAGHSKPRRVIDDEMGLCFVIKRKREVPRYVKWE